MLLLTSKALTPTPNMSTPKQLAYWESKKGKPSWNKGIPWSENSKAKMRERKLENPVKFWLGNERPEQIGSKNKNWKGGITPINAVIRTSAEYANWRTEIFKRDNYTCQECGSSGVELNADHIKPFAYFPELRLRMDNGRTLCVSCHKKTDTFAGCGMKRIYNTNLKANTKSINTNPIANTKSLNTNI